MSNYIGNPGGVGSSTIIAPTVTASSIPPPTPNPADIWHDTDDNITYLRIDAGGGNQIWLDISSSSGQRPKMTSGATLPASPIIGDHHYDIDDGKVYIYTNDGTSNIWLDITA